MKKLFSILLLSLGTAVTAMAHSFSVGDIYYNINSDNTTVTVTSDNGSQSSYKGMVTIPSTVTYDNVTYTVTGIGYKAFYESRQLTNVYLPETILTIGESAFEASGIQSITLPQALKRLGKYAFYNCSNLAGVGIYDNIEYFGKSAFGCTRFYQNDIYWTDGVLYMGNYLVGTESTMPSTYRVREGTVGIAESAFGYQSHVTEVHLPYSVKYICPTAFVGCTSLATINVPSTVKVIGDYAFAGCSAIKKFILDCKDPASILTGTSLFNNTSLGASFLHVPKGCTDSYSKADQWKEIGNLRELTFDFCQYNPDGSNIFYSIQDYDQVHVDYLEEYTATYEGSVSVPEQVTFAGDNYKVTGIGYNAFRSCPELTKVVLPSSVTTIGESAFQDSKNLKELTLPNSITTLGSSAFYGCSGLTELTLPKNLTNIGDFAFYRCTGLTDLEIPDAVTSIDKCAFAGCTALESLTVRNTHPENFNMGTFVFLEVPKTTCQLNIPKGSTAKYTALDQWKDFKVMKEGCYAFMDVCANVPIYYNINDDDETLTVTYEKESGGSYSGSVIIPELVKHGDKFYKVNTIGEKAFNWCTDLTEISFKRNIKNIENFAFYACFGLKDLTVNNPNPEDITISEMALEGVPMESATIYVPEGKTHDYEAMEPWSGFHRIIELFMNCDFCEPNDQGTTFCYNRNDEGKTASVTFRFEKGNDYAGDIVIPETVTNRGTTYTVTAVGEDAFASCGNLTSVTIPNTVTELGRYAMCYTGLKTVKIPSSVTKIGFSCFQESDEIESVYMMNPEPASIELDDIFFEVPIDQIPLYVPLNSKAKYEQIEPWKDFKEIIEVDYSGIDGITEDTDSESLYYDLQGRRVLNPSEGIFIRNGRKVIVK